MPESRVLQEPADNADHANPIAHRGELWTETADAAHDEIDLDAGLRRAIERVDDFGVDEGVHLPDDAGRPARLGVFGFSRDQLDEPCAHVHRCDEELSVESLARVAS